jgi:hypothetical protein
VNTLLADLAADALPSAPQPDAPAFEALVHERQPKVVTYAGWQRLDAHELEKGKAAGRPRWKITSVPEMLQAIDGE